ncbi:hypothetical protein MY5147_002177 [Beauveria neobassiana]|uniref:Uncharacterized protein n=3 Tax=Beauveria bassiana TaxID=176275 RepID=J5JW37_BEAB2|nr:uncharacterized protein BBA_01883 [Beauveria bassiana ARSEF 2860]EJP68848.1 hypothetical protein BBA_01883 [Beauveria bassiana ARSEF 2860]KAF1739086.1 hypothetical protein CRV24_001018 [Beauveria bassiana]KGQ08692.1 hypothetical protein BBAD15_g5961 [Beauveria bassiana D1-5]PQK08658.1 hypothetical protein BB8028_0001g07310 [Beauveria bassiana]
MSQRASTPVKVPSSAADYTPATLDPDLRSQINTILLRDGHVPKIQERLLHALNADSSNWPTVIQSHALQLLRSGEVLTFPALLRRVLDDVQEATAKAAAATNNTAAAGTNGKAAPTTNGSTTTNNDVKLALAVPQAVVEDTIRVTKECLESVCEIED